MTTPNHTIVAGPQYNGKASKRMHVMAKPIGAVCNLDCDYCYYLSKQDLLEYKKGCSPQLSKGELENYIKQYIEQQNTPEIIFSWQGGEPTLLGLDFFRRVVELQEKYRPNGVVISNDLQTNGVLLNDAWCSFLRKNNFLVGLSIDGPELLHNAYRVNKAGRGTFNQVMKAVTLLHKHQVSFATLTCVNNLTANEPVAVYRFLRDVVRSPQIQFIPIVEQKNFRQTAPQKWQQQDVLVWSDTKLEPSQTDSIMEHWSVSAEQWGEFLCAVFDEWLKADVGRVFVQYFEAAAQAWMGKGNPLCQLNQLCGKGLAMEPNGDVYSCDHYVYPEYRLGNIHEQRLDYLAYSSRQQKFGYSKTNSLTKQCNRCDYLFTCFGDCPKNRFVESEDGEIGQSYLCAGWKRFFAHIDQSLSFLLRSANAPLRYGRHAKLHY